MNIMNYDNRKRARHHFFYGVVGGELFSRPTGVYQEHESEICSCRAYSSAYILLLALLKRPDDRRVALVALWPQSRSAAETEGTERRHDIKSEIYFESGWS